MTIADASNARTANPRPLVLFRFLIPFIVQSPTFVLGVRRNFKTSIRDDGIALRGTMSTLGNKTTFCDAEAMSRSQ